MSSQALRVFVSYSHEDEELRKGLEEHLIMLERSGTISVWHDRKLLPGAEWSGEIDQNLEKADLILLLVSSGFLKSDYCYDKEMKRAMERHERGEATVVPIIVRHVYGWQKAP